jgi:hypothetical protein
MVAIRQKRGQVRSHCRFYPFYAVRLAVIVTAAASVSFFKPEFGDFLYAAIGADRNEMPLTVLSALSRLDDANCRGTLPVRDWLR